MANMTQEEMDNLINANDIKESNLIRRNKERNEDEVLNNNTMIFEGKFTEESLKNDEHGANNEAIFDSSESKFLPVLISVRAFSFVAWTVSILYATYHVYAACEAHLQYWYKDPTINPGSLSSFLNRGKDSTDYEWEMFSILYVTRLWFWYGGFVALSRVVQPLLPNQWGIISIGLSFVMFWELVGIITAVFMFLQPVIYWLIARSRSKLLAWTATVFFIYNLNSPFTKAFHPTDSFAEYFFVITSAWNYARCISFCYDVWSAGEQNIGMKYLENILHFCFYLPLSISGPLVTYESFEKKIINRDIETLRQRNTPEDLLTLLKKLAKVGLIALLNELVLHFIYFRALSYAINVHRRLSLWAICGTIYWLGQFFAMKYKVLYGIPTAIAEFDGMEMPPLPTCPSHIHRYSTLWREFDAGLYRFLVRYIYIPTLHFIQETDKSKKIPADVQKLMASFLTYVYVYMWHSLSFDVFVWTALNFLGITLERIGSTIKRKIDKLMSIEPIYWDFIVEPVITVPLAAMSILNSSIFCGSMDAAASFSGVLWRRRADNWVFVILYFFTHTAVTQRTWRHKLQKLFLSKMKRS